MLFASSLAMFPGAAAGQLTWRTTDWEVVCTTELENLIVSTAEERAAHIERLLAQYEDRWNYATEEEARRAATEWLETQLRRAQACLSDDEAGLLRLAEEQLESSSRWLRGLGFGGPTIHPFPTEEPVDALLDPVRAVLCRVSYCAAIDALPHAHGVYQPEDLSLRLGLDWSRALTPDKDARPGNVDAAYTPTHELFHAIQFGYENGVPRDNPGPWRWLLEGSAELVQLRAVERGGTLMAPQLVRRHYDDQLHIPPTTQAGRRFSDWAYGSWEFFDFLGEYVGSTDGVQYLDKVFESQGQKNGLEAVEAAIQAESGKGLYEAFPDFVARRLVYPCYFTDLGTWKDGGCADGPDNQHRFKLTFPDTIQRLDHLAAAVSANGYLVRMEVPEGKKGHLTIRVPPDQNEEYLHLIVDDQRRDEPGLAGRRNEYTTVLPAGPREFFVRLANVPRDLSTVDTDGFSFHGAPIEFILVEYDAVVTYSGGLRGSFEAKEDNRFGVLYGIDPHPTYCAANLTLSSEEGDFVSIGGFLPAPLAPGRFPIIPRTNLPRPGVTFAEVGAPCEKGGCYESGLAKGQRRRFFEYQGEFEITEVTDFHVAGRFAMTGGGADHVTGVRGYYSVQLGSGEGFPPNHPCDPSPPPPAPEPGSKPEGGRGGEPPATPGGEPPATPAEEPPATPGGKPPATPGGKPPATPSGKPPATPGGKPPARPEREAEPDASTAELREPELILEFLENGRSVLTSEPQGVQGTGSVTSVELSSDSYDVTLALPIFECSVRPSDQSAYQRLLQSSRAVDGRLLLDLTAGKLRLDAASGELVLNLESGARRVTMRGTAESAVGLWAEGPTVISGNISDVTLEVTLDEERLSCIEPQGVSFSISEAR